MENIFLYGLLNFGEEAADRYLSKLENTFNTNGHPAEYPDKFPPFQPVRD
ncbi:hypothetical protein [Brenneria alni]|nr:hypothetical protein [Brenneria alni]